MAGDVNRRRGSVQSEEAEIVDLSDEGHGVAKLDGKAVFVADALPGERVLLRRTRRRPNYDEAVLVEVRQPSGERVAAACPHYGVCGGCALQHLAPPAQVAFKQARLLENLERTGRVTPQTVLDPLTGPVWNYRRRARLGAKYVLRKQRVVVGFRERSAPYVADLGECRVLASPADRLIEPLAGLIQGLSIANRVPQVELAVTDEVSALVLRVLSPPTDSDLEQLRAFEAAWPVRLYLQSGGPDSIVPLLEGGGALRYSLPDYDLHIAFQPTDFVQVNARINEAMIGQAIRLLGAVAGATVLDLYSGLGNFSLPLARVARQVVGVEGDPGLVERARGNARDNGLGNVSFHVADLSKDCSDLPWAGRGYDGVLLDPPRAGAGQVLGVIAASGASRVVYVSCNPGTLASDAGRLVHEYGFRLAAAGVMDMFPHTIHSEAMALFER
jgi:23S rRNA (uracil1939-C5)-methyltransferase